MDIAAGTEKYGLDELVRCLKNGPGRNYKVVVMIDGQRHEIWERWFVALHVHPVSSRQTTNEDDNTDVDTVRRLAFDFTAGVRLLAAGVMNCIRHSAFDAFWQLLLDLLGYDRGLTSVFGVTPRDLRVGIGRCVVSLCWTSMIYTQHFTCCEVLRFSPQRQQCDQVPVPAER